MRTLLVLPLVTMAFISSPVTASATVVQRLDSCRAIFVSAARPVRWERYYEGEVQDLRAFDEIQRLRLAAIPLMPPADWRTDRAAKPWRMADVQVHRLVVGRARVTGERIAYLNRMLQLSNSGLVEESQATKLDAFMTWYRANEKTLTPVKLAAESYRQLISMRPFPAANEQTARFVTDWVLRRAGLPPALYAKDVTEESLTTSLKRVKRLLEAVN